MPMSSDDFYPNPDLDNSLEPYTFDTLLKDIRVKLFPTRIYADLWEKVKIDILADTDLGDPTTWTPPIDQKLEKVKDLVQIHLQPKVTPIAPARAKREQERERAKNQEKQATDALEYLVQNYALMVIKGHHWNLVTTDSANPNFNLFDHLWTDKTMERVEEVAGRSSAIPAWRRNVKRVYTKIGMSLPEHCDSRTYNLYRGLACKPKPGNCEKYLAHLHHVICSGDQGKYEYLLNWLALSVQQPFRLPLTALVVRSRQGAGKGIAFKEPFKRIFGPHFYEANSPHQIFGRFNTQLLGKLFVLADEAVWDGAKGRANIGRIKTMITSEDISVEAKGQDIVECKSYLHFVFASNEIEAVPLEIDDRRFVFLNADDSHIDDRTWFRNIKHELDNGGAEALLHGLLTRDITNFEPMDRPRTEDKVDALMEAEPVLHYIFWALDNNYPLDNAFQPVEGNLSYKNQWQPVPCTDPRLWKDKIRREDFRYHFNIFCDLNRIPRLSPNLIGRRLDYVFFGTKDYFNGQEHRSIRLRTTKEATLEMIKERLKLKPNSTKT